MITSNGCIVPFPVSHLSLGGLISIVMVTGSRIESADSSSLSRLQENNSRPSIDV